MRDGDFEKLEWMMRQMAERFVLETAGLEPRSAEWNAALFSEADRILTAADDIFRRERGFLKVVSQKRRRAELETLAPLLFFAGVDRLLNDGAGNGGRA